MKNRAMCSYVITSGGLIRGNVESQQDILMLPCEHQLAVKETCTLLKQAFQ